MTSVPASGHALLARIAASSAVISQMTACATCMTPTLVKPAKKCNGCRIVQYCSKECQRSAWPTHKAFCHLVSGNEKNAAAFLSSMEPADMVNFVLDIYRCKVSWNEQHLAKMSDLLGPKVSPIFHVTKRAIRGDRTEADFARFLQGAVDSGILPAYMQSPVAIKGCVTSAVHPGNEHGLSTPADVEALASKYKNVNIDVALLILAERVVGFDAAGPPQGLKMWMDGLTESVKAHPKAVDYVQQIEMDRLAARTA